MLAAPLVNVGQHITAGKLKALGVQLIDQAPRKGAEGKLIAFIHPKETGGVLIELCEAPRHPVQEGQAT